jgi:hypothetical protein
MKPMDAQLPFGLVKGKATNIILSPPFLCTMQTRIDYEHNTIMLNKLGAAKLTMFDNEVRSSSFQGDSNPPIIHGPVQSQSATRSEVTPSRPVDRNG